MSELRFTRTAPGAITIALHDFGLGGEYNEHAAAQLELSGDTLSLALPGGAAAPVTLGAGQPLRERIITGLDELRRALEQTVTTLRDEDDARIDELVALLMDGPAALASLRAQGLPARVNGVELLSMTREGAEVECVLRSPGDVVTTHRAPHVTAVLSLIDGQRTLEFGRRDPPGGQWQFGIGVPEDDGGDPGEH